MRQFSSSIFVAALVVLPAHLAAADNLLGLYVGGAVGQGQVAVSAYSASYASQAVGSNVPAGADELKENHVAFKGIAGIRPLSLIGAELEYVDLVHVHETLFNYPADASMKGAAAFGLLYLPVPVVDIYLKAGVAHLQSSLNAAVPYQNPPPSVPSARFRALNKIAPQLVWQRPRESNPSSAPWQCAPNTSASTLPVNIQIWPRLA